MKKTIIIVGGGHAGVEAANIISKMEGRVLIITKNLNNIGEISCNPSVGGLGKSQIVREIDSLGGIMGFASTISSLNIKKINISKGESVSCTRSQICRNKYKKILNKILKKNNIKIIQEEVIKIIIKNNYVIGVKTKMNKYRSDAVIITVGTFLKAKIYIGLKNYKEGRINEKNTTNLSNQLNTIIGESKKLKTGTPPRIDLNNINMENLKIQKSDKNPIPSLSSWYNLKKFKKTKNCWITKTSQKTKNIIKKSLYNSSIYNNLICGNSPRYCPSIEEKIYKFYKKKKHNIFLEPEDENLFYPSGLSTCLEYKQQIELIKSIIGLKNSNIVKPGYAVEYDFFCPKNLKKSLETKNIKGLFFAGQINGTTGYEEAAGQGIVAGINSFLYCKNKKYWYPNKKNSYIGLMLNEITTTGLSEPYRVFTSKNSNRILLRENNSNERILKVSKNLNILNNNNYKFKNLNFIKKYKKNYINNIIILKFIKKFINVYFKYKNYIKIQMFKNIKKKTLVRNFRLPKINYFKINNISNELSEKLNKIYPKTINEIKNIKNMNFENFKIILKYLKNLK